MSSSSTTPLLVADDKKTSSGAVPEIISTPYISGTVSTSEEAVASQTTGEINSSRFVHQRLHQSADEVNHGSAVSQRMSFSADNSQEE